MAEQGQLQRVLTFSLFDKVCGIPIADVEEVVPLPNLITVPGMPSLLEGYFNLGGRAIAVLNLNHLLGLTHFKKDIYCSVICLKGGSYPLSFLVHRSLSVLSFQSDSVRSTSPSESINGVVTGLFDHKTGPISLLSTANILTEKEHLIVAEFVRAFQERVSA